MKKVIKEMILKKKNLAFSMFIIILTYSCTNKKNIYNQVIDNTNIVKDSIALTSIEERNNLKEDFHSFYKKFHTDSLFQLQRIEFPLDGYNIGEDYNPDKDSDDFKWTRENWNFMHLPEMTDSEMKVETKNIDSITVREIIYIPNSGFKVERTFSFKKGRWCLVFFGNQSL